MESDRKNDVRLRGAFENWVRTWPGPQLIVLPPRSTNATSASYALADVAREIVISVSHGISVAVMRGDVCWDLLADFDVLPQREADGRWKCGYPDCRDAACHPSEEALLRAHVFDPLGKWLLKTLHPAKWLELNGGHGVTWARLTTELDPDPAHVCVWIRVHEME